MVLTPDPAAAAQQLAKIYGEAFDDKYFGKDSVAGKIKLSAAVKYLMDSAPAPVPESFKNACTNVLSDESRGKVEAAYTF